MNERLFTKGDIVNIYNANWSGQFFFEGKAEVIRPSSESEDRYQVRFKDQSKNIFVRFIDPNGQGDPNAYVTFLNQSRSVA